MLKDFKELSDFAHSALVLDEDFALLKRLSEELERIDLHSEFGLTHSKKLLIRYTECGKRIGDEIQILAKTLDQARLEAEEQANRVMQIAFEIQKKSDENNLSH